MTLRILIVDDHPIFREGLRSFLESEPDLSVCGEAADVDSALALVESERPECMVVDLSLEGSNGLHLIEKVSKQYPSIRMLVTTMHSEAIYGERAIKAGASGFINKQDASINILKAIRLIMRGEMYLSRNLTARLLNRVATGGHVDGSPAKELSNRELEVFTLIGTGLTTKRIAGKLNLSTKTVDTHKDHIKRKLGASDNSELVVRAVQWVLTSQGSQF